MHHFLPCFQFCPSSSNFQNIVSKSARMHLDFKIVLAVPTSKQSYQIVPKWFLLPLVSKWFQQLQSIVSNTDRLQHLASLFSNCSVWSKKKDRIYFCLKKMTNEKHFFFLQLSFNLSTECTIYHPRFKKKSQQF